MAGLEQRWSERIQEGQTRHSGRRSTVPEEGCCWVVGEEEGGGNICKSLGDRGRGMEEGKETVLCAKHFAASLITGTEWVKPSEK